MKKKKKILYIVESMGGGVLTYIVDLTNNLCEEFDIYIAYGVREQTPKNLKDYFNKKIKLIEVTNFTRNLNLLKDIKSCIEIKKIERYIKPDIIHMHSSKAGGIGRIVCNSRKAKLFYTPHGYSFLMKNQSNIKSKIYKLIERVLALKKCKIISCSLGEHNESLSFTNNAIFVNNGININKLEQINNDNNKCNCFTVFTIGRICEQKNPKLFNSIANEMPDVKFIWIGDGELKNELNSSNIEVTGWITREQVLKVASSCSVFILTSLWEGLPISLLEAMYMKKVCIVSNVIGNRDVIKNKVNGYVCKTKEEFISSINSIRYNNHEKLTNTAYDNILESYNTDIMANKYKEIYINNR